ncbi:hypothetical protein [Lutispora sp.]|uniref:hypothetical protein n=1 Tax=Lutispora sp. TaxID=2828727 RepID=UPI003565507C
MNICGRIHLETILGYFRKDNWFLDKAKTHIVMNEVVKIGSYFEEYIGNYGGYKS